MSDRDPFQAQLQARFALYHRGRGRGRGRASFGGFGSVLGKMTVAEADELIKAKDYDFTQIAQKYIQVGPNWRERNPAEYADFMKDYMALMDRWATAKQAVQKKLTVLAAGFSLLPNSAIPAQAEYDQLLEALTRTPGRWQKGDIQDIHDRLSKAGIAANVGPVVYPNQPQPKAPDLDIKPYQAADVVVKKVETIGDELLSKKGLLIAGGVFGGLLLLNALKR